MDNVIIGLAVVGFLTLCCLAGVFAVEFFEWIGNVNKANDQWMFVSDALTRISRLENSYAIHHKVISDLAEHVRSIPSKEKKK